MSARGGFQSDTFAANGKTIPSRREEQKTPDQARPQARHEFAGSPATILREESCGHPPHYWQALLLFPENLNYQPSTK
jgi:hypothetical protein